MDLKITGFPPIKDLSEKVSKLAEGEEQSIAEESGQGGQIRNGNHLAQFIQSSRSEIQKSFIPQAQSEIFHEREREGRSQRDANTCGPHFGKSKSPQLIPIWGL